MLFVNREVIKITGLKIKKIMAEICEDNSRDSESRSPWTAHEFSRYCQLQTLHMVLIVTCNQNNWETKKNVTLHIIFVVIAAAVVLRQVLTK